MFIKGLTIHSVHHLGHTCNRKNRLSHAVKQHNTAIRKRSNSTTQQSEGGQTAHRRNQKSNNTAITRIQHNTYITNSTPQTQAKQHNKAVTIQTARQGSHNPNSTTRQSQAKQHNCIGSHRPNSTRQLQAKQHKASQTAQGSHRPNSTRQL